MRRPALAFLIVVGACKRGPVTEVAFAHAPLQVGAAWSTETTLTQAGAATGLHRLVMKKVLAVDHERVTRLRVEYPSSAPDAVAGRSYVVSLKDSGAFDIEENPTRTEAALIADDVELLGQRSDALLLPTMTVSVGASTPWLAEPLKKLALEHGLADLGPRSLTLTSVNDDEATFALDVAHAADVLTGTLTVQLSSSRARTLTLASQPDAGPGALTFTFTITTREL